MPGATPAMEIASSAFMSFWMNNIGVEIALLQPLIKRYFGEEADANQLLLTLLFLHLSFFFSPTYARASGGAIHNPTVYVLFYLLGQVTLAAAVVGFLCTVLGTILGTFAYIETLRVFPMPGFSGVSPVVCRRDRCTAPPPKPPSRSSIASSQASRSPPSASWDPTPARSSTSSPSSWRNVGTRAGS